MQNSKRLKLSFVACASIVGLIGSGCTQGFEAISSPVADRIDNGLGCATFEDRLWTAFTEHIEIYGVPPRAGELEIALRKKLNSSGRLRSMSQKNQEELVSLSKELTKTIGLRTVAGTESEILAKSQVSTQTEDDSSASESAFETQKALWLERVAQLEIGDRTTDAKSADVDAVRKTVEAMKVLAENSNLDACEEPPPFPDPEPTPEPSPLPGPQPTPEPLPTATPLPNPTRTLFEMWKETRALPVYGGLKTVAVAYQSCEAGSHNPLGSETPNIRGISVVGRHSSGTGNIREIKDLGSVIATHPYLKNYKRPLPQCHDVLKAPPIYDYGGKPYTTSSNEKLIDLFRNGGSGSKELGIDCSAFVYTSYAVSGLKLKKESALKASLIKGVSSSMMADPQKNGLTCLDHASYNAKESLKAGDIIAIKGHVIMAEDISDDPFGVDGFASASDCKLANMDVGRFDFTLLQSSPEKGGIGINRMKAKYYLSNSSTMGAGLREHAVNACKAKFQSKPIVSKSTKASVVRHNGSSACRETALTLAKEECLSSCSAAAVEQL